MPNFQTPNLKSDRGTAVEPYISVRSDRMTVGINQSAAAKLDPTPGEEYLRFALDRTYAPWIGIIQDQTEQNEPRIYDADPGIAVNCKLLCSHLLKLLDGEPEGVARFYLEGSTQEDPDTGITMHRLEVPEVE